MKPENELPPYKIDHQGIYYHLPRDNKFSPIDIVDGKFIFLTPHIIQERGQWRCHQNDYLEAYHHQGVHYGEINPRPDRTVVRERTRNQNNGRFISPSAASGEQPI